MPSQRPRASVTKVASAATLARVVRQARSRGRTIVFTNGCFDILHAGHVTLLERAKRLGDVLVVAINSDRSVRRLKGPTRPMVGQRDRATLLAALESVDYVTVFNDETPERLIELLHPDVLVKGSDWGRGQIVGSDIIQRTGGRVVRLPLLKQRSTSRLIQRIQTRSCA